MIPTLPTTSKSSSTESVTTGERQGSFSEVSSLGVEIPAIEYRTGSEPNRVRKLPGLSKFTNIVLKRGIISDLTFWNWLVKTMQGNVQRTTVTIILLDENRNPVLRWNFVRAWPCGQPTKITARVTFRDARETKLTQTIRHNLEIYRNIGYTTQPQ